jgi:hypothetical protein
VQAGFWGIWGLMQEGGIGYGDVSLKGGRWDMGGRQVVLTQGARQGAM